MSGFVNGEPSTGPCCTSQIKTAERGKNYGIGEASREGPFNTKGVDNGCDKWAQDIRAVVQKS